MKFAKLFERDGRQVLVKVDQSEGDLKPEVRFFFKPKGLGVCSAAVEYKDDSEKSWNSADKFFDSIDEEKAFAFAEKCMKQYAGIVSS